VDIDKKDGAKGSLGLGQIISKYKGIALWGLCAKR
jgi:hypothetical protein